MLTDLIAWVTGVQPLELLAAVTALAFTTLAVWEKRLAWVMAMISTSLYIWLFWDVSLPLNAALNVYYLVMAVYGWWVWRPHAQPVENLHIHRWSWQRHLLGISLALFFGLLIAYGLKLAVNSAYPFLDALVSTFSVLATLMMTRKVQENWLYWVVVDALAAYLAYLADLRATMVLMLIYVALVMWGWFKWQQRRGQQSEVGSAFSPTA